MPGNTSTCHPLKLNLKSTKHLALNLGYHPDGIDYFRNNKNNNVQELILRQRKNGKLKERTVYNPSREYKKLLRAINSKFLRKATFPDGVLGGLVGKSIDDMAGIHCHQEAVLSMDLKNFFPSIKSGRVVKFFRQSGYAPDVAGILTDLVTIDGSLPQGFPTSPLMANLITFGLDVQHIAQGKKYNLNRSRWIDDIVFSGRSADLTIGIKSLLGAIKPHGFQLNNKKTEYSVRSNSPTVVGLDVSGRCPRMPIVVIEKLRQILCECQQSGVNAVQTAYESDSFGRKKDLKSSLSGRIRNIAIYNKPEGDELHELFNSIDWD